MQNECNQRHIPNFETSCCYKHLILMRDHADKSLLYSKYAKLVLLTLNRAYKENALSFETVKLEMIKVILEIICKAISHFYYLKKLDYVKVLTRIGIKACEDTPFKDHPDIHVRLASLLNNLSCAYEM
jgi:hypothetical protein